MNAHAYHHPHPLARRVNPTAIGPIVGAVVGVTLVTTGVVLAVRHVNRGGSLFPFSKPSPSTPSLNGLFAEGATLGASPVISQHVRLPIALTTGDMSTSSFSLDELREEFPLVTRAYDLEYRDQEGEFLPLDVFFATSKVAHMHGPSVGLHFDSSLENSRDEVLRLVTNLTGAAATDAFNAATSAVMTRDDLFDEPSVTRDGFVRAFVNSRSPGAWPESPEQLPPGSAAYKTWMGVDLISQIAYQVAWLSRSA